MCSIISLRRNVAQNVVRALLFFVLPGPFCFFFLQSQTLHCYFFFSISHLFYTLLSSNYLGWAQAGVQLPSSPIFHKHRIKALQRGVESWDASLGADICVSYFSTSSFTSNQRALPRLFLLQSIFFSTMVRGGQLKCRTTLSCLRFSIHAGMSTHSYSMSVSLRLAKRSGRTSVQHHPFISVGGEIFFFFLQTQERNFNQERMKRKFNNTVIPNWSRTAGNEHNVSCMSSRGRILHFHISASLCVGVFKEHFQSLRLPFCPPLNI